jgi:hypothetical protein
VQVRILDIEAERDLGEFAMHGLAGGVGTALRQLLHDLQLGLAKIERAETLAEREPWKEFLPCF